MFCPNCGKQIANNAAFCPECGKTVKGASAPTATPNATPTAAPATPGAPTTPVSKLNYFTKVAPKQKRTRTYIALALGVLCILFVFLSANTTVNGSIFEAPIGSLALDEDGAKIQAKLDRLVDEYKELESYEIESRLDNILGFSINVIHGEEEEVLELLSPLSMSNIVELYERFGGGKSDDAQIFSTIITVIWIYAVILMALTALGVAFQKTWLMVLAFVLGALFILGTGGFVYLLLAAISYIVTAVLFSKMKTEYKVYTELCARGIQ